MTQYLIDSLICMVLVICVIIVVFFALVSITTMTLWVINDEDDEDSHRILAKLKPSLILSGIATLLIAFLLPLI